MKEKIAEKIDQACREVVLGEEVVNLKKQLGQQLGEAKQNLAVAQRQVIVWEARVQQVTGSLATCNTLMGKKQKPKSLILESGNTHKKEQK